MKKITIALLGAGLIGLTGCNDPSPTPTVVVTTTVPSATTPSASPSPSGKITKLPTPGALTDKTTAVATPSKIPTTKPKPKKQAKTIALTFDDGPTFYTPQVLKILEAKGVKATFFVLGEQVDSSEGKYTKQAVDAGMSVQSHSYRHSDLTRLSNEAIRTDLSKTSKSIAKVTGETPTCVRPPYGARTTRVDNVIEGMGLESVLWDADSEDWKKPGTQKLINTVMKEAHPGGTILMHDGGGIRSQTLAALPVIIDKLKAQGYTFVTLCS